jgi:plasmid stabilization system protein ParE
MALPHFVLSPEAVADLEAIANYIAAESGVERARSGVARLYRSLNMLAY